MGLQILFLPMYQSHMWLKWFFSKGRIRAKQDKEFADTHMSLQEFSRQILHTQFNYFPTVKTLSICVHSNLFKSKTNIL